jgi:hypothetical protein
MAPPFFGAATMAKLQGEDDGSMTLSLSYMYILLRAIHQMFIDEAAYAE